VWELARQIVAETWSLLGQMAPFLLLGFLVAGLLSVCVSPVWVERHLGGRGPWPVVAASLLGVPLPLCSCGVIPVAAALRKHGASRAATTAFLLSTPQTGVDSIAVTYALLGPVFAVFRPVAALATGVVGGCLVWFLDRRPGAVAAAEESARSLAAASGGTNGEGGQESTPRNAVVRMVRYALVTLPGDIGPALMVGVVIAGAMAALVPPNQLHAYIGGGVLSILVLMAVGVPVYVCATASVPVAAGMMHMGASPGAALAFLIAGPATNAAAIATVWKVLGRRTALAYLATIAVSAVGSGLLLDSLMAGGDTIVTEGHSHVHGSGGVTGTSHVYAVALLSVLLVSGVARRRGPKPRVREDASAAEVLLEVSGMTCSHCADTVRRALETCEGVTFVEVDLRSGHVRVGGHDLRTEALESRVGELGFGVRRA